MVSSSYKHRRFPAVLIAHAVWLYPLPAHPALGRGAAARARDYRILRDHPPVGGEFGLRYRPRCWSVAPRPRDIWHLDEVRVVIRGEVHWLWRAVDQHGVALEEIAQRRRSRRCSVRGTALELIARKSG